MEALWLPFELHPGIAAEGVPRERYFPPGRLAQAEAHMSALAREVGLEMRSPERVINTRLALATAEHARDRGAFDAVHRALFRAHWEGAARLDSIPDLLRIAAACGLDPGPLEEALREGRYLDRLVRHRREAEELGIGAIPAHVFGSRFLVVGAHPYEVLRQVVDRVGSEGAGGRTPLD